ncbi:MAG TPA: DUF1338 domain-containing protein [Oligoflexus sp.]|uniref:DUF1338 domain-containing protein n=1 Tax=Oligoflexus sp. TaxID=1971216 RepID=UPI002D283842|nr:DUF1338 domain-containing protein [Oligoflexus sp.]HYX31618.1 DUF1338 domain-containing protein [Oligoflexus sp.]
MELIDQCRREVFKRLWAHYSQLVPIVPKLNQAFKDRGEDWTEDHVAYRTLPGEFTGAHILQGVFEALGYSRKDDYFFEAKQLKAFWLCPPDVQGHTRDASPKIFVSELIPTKFSSDFQEVIRRLGSQVTASPLRRIQQLRDQVRGGNQLAIEQMTRECVTLLTTFPSWSRPSLRDYEVLKKESEYASWTMLFGHQINHFTVSVHLLKSFQGIRAVADFLEKDLKVPMNHSGGVVKGTSDLLLEQISTMAVDIDYAFQEGVEKVPYGFVEFAYRYPMSDKKHDGLWQSYYQGFVTSNADKIFESTFKK